MAVNRRKIAYGFSLLEMLLVMVIVGSIVFMGNTYWQQQLLNLHTEKTSTQIQQILNAGLAFYVASKVQETDTNVWPLTLGCLSGQGLTVANCKTVCDDSNNANVISYCNSCVGDSKKCYLQGANLKNILNGTFTAGYDVTTVDTSKTIYTSAPAFKVSIDLPAGTKSYIATTIKAKVPLSEISGSSATGYKITTYINVPGETLNKIPAARFAGLYHHGACIPVPKCPPNTVPRVLVLPVSISGIHDTPSQLETLSSFTAYANGSDGDAFTNKPWACGIHDTGNIEVSTTGSITDTKGAQDCPNITGVNYWRACVQIITSVGDIYDLNPDKGSTPPAAGHGKNSWGQNVTLMAITRCAMPSETAGSNFTVIFK